jgi:hypothetical protein
LNLKEMGSRYLFIVLYVFFEHHLSRGDYRRRDAPAGAEAQGWRAGMPSVLVRNGFPPAPADAEDTPRIHAGTAEVPRATD